MMLSGLTELTHGTFGTASSLRFPALIRSAIHSIFWIIDGIDVVEKPRTSLKTSLTCICSTCQSESCWLVGAPTSWTPCFEGYLPRCRRPTHIEMDGRVEHLAAYVNRELTLFRDLDLRKSLTERVMEGAQNNFLASPDNPTATCCINNHELGGYYWQVLWLVMGAPSS